MTRAADKRSLVRRPSVIKYRGAPPPPPEPKRPGYMVRGDGDRDETCGRYADCLMAAAKAPACSWECPAECRFREATVERATEYVSTGGCYLARADVHRVW